MLHYVDTYDCSDDEDDADEDDGKKNLTKTENSIHDV